MHSFLTRFIVVLALVIFISACGSGGGGSATGKSNQLSGVAAVGAPLSGVKVEVVSMTTVSARTSTTTAANGSYVVDLPGAAPYMVRVCNPTAVGGVCDEHYNNADGSWLYSYATGTGSVANIQPLTNLVIEGWYDVNPFVGGTALHREFGEAFLGRPSVLYSHHPSVATVNEMSSQIAKLISNLYPGIEGIGGIKDVLTAQFVAGSGHGLDALLDNLGVNLANTLKSTAALVSKHPGVFERYIVRSGVIMQLLNEAPNPGQYQDLGVVFSDIITTAGRLDHSTVSLTCPVRESSTGIVSDRTVHADENCAPSGLSICVDYLYGDNGPLGPQLYDHYGDGRILGGGLYGSHYQIVGQCNFTGFDTVTHTWVNEMNAPVVAYNGPSDGHGGYNFTGGMAISESDSGTGYSVRFASTDPNLGPVSIKVVTVDYRIGVQNITMPNLSGYTVGNYPIGLSNPAAVGSFNTTNDSSGLIQFFVTGWNGELLWIQDIRI